MSGYGGDAPCSETAPRKIAGGPLYAIAEVLALATGATLQLWSNGAKRDAAKWELDTGDVAELLASAISRNGYLGSEWCLAKPGGPWAACDAYKVKRLEWCDAAHKDIEITYYLKVAISRTGKLLLSASNHPEGA